MAGRRVHERYERAIPVVIEHDGAQHPATSQNVSLGGMYLVTDATLPYGTEVRLRFRLPSLKEDTVTAATVRWSTAEGIGVQFRSLRAVEVWALNQLFKST